MDNGTLTTTPEALRDAIEQSVRGWVMATPIFENQSRHNVIADLTQHLFGNVVMALRFGADTQEARNAAMYQGMADAKTLCVHGLGFGLAEDGMPHSITRCGTPHIDCEVIGVACDPHTHKAIVPKADHDCPHGYRYGNMYGCPT